ncbi:Na+/H+ antiporter subunit E [Coxiella burnetii]|uniref:Sodium/proton antiporter protein n=1 Tax=Coxiella burnetii (strain RSA 493 / Nine Mile phase I) TaxID=227377 RepID=Q83BC7_COXBU|nr:Na+/H+ antiporter subunit E [Coxiella burnetii]NP_820567.1 sodium/proton antiporter protein [Coxiella burnetii RSA 493]AAO91081.1 sodium/proton antiporter protein [Coxiella burnetii RSA 493]ABX78767.1 Na(+)/H(+) antiporter subunit E [Coxiella burnetii RSA 331]AML48515.1 sodium:proton antiporter [Coxiella burnetii]AML54513.1 sodium:proton antiporter [Coxiella burnetii]ARI66345.1 sodium:proton antiporter [Coxiella burnetii]
MSRILRYPYKAYLIIKFILFLLWEILIANFRVAHEVLTPHFRARPGVLAIPLDCRTPVEITLFANIISLTPGTLTLDISEDQKTLYVHAMFIDDVDQLKAEIKHKFEKPIMEILA